MEKETGNQLELFSKPKDEFKLPGNRFDKAYFTKYIWGYEKTILIVIAFLVTGIVSFSLGVEKGRRAQVNQPGIMASKPQILQPQSETGTVAKQPVALPLQEAYTIQVASFKANSYAQKEVELLNKRGYKAVTLNKGEYIILCVGNFPSKEQAQSLLLELNRYYKDCRIRRL